MAALDHWHPLAPSSALRSGGRLAKRLCGQDIVLFRGDGGMVGALVDRCPHRGMRLSFGEVAGERLICPYHGWSFASDGAGQSPGTPQVKVCTEAFEVEERSGLIWVKRAGSTAQIPDLDWDGFGYAGVLVHQVDVPLEVVLDNFTEVEHTPMVHALLGYDRSRIAEVQVEAEIEDDSVRVINKGAQRPLPLLVRVLFGIRASDIFIDDWTTFFSPVYSVYDQSWTSADGETLRDAVRVAVFFNPIDEGRTELLSYVAVKDAGTNLYWSFKKWTLCRLVDHEVKLDKRMVEQLADKSVSLDGRCLGRFDRALRENRKRLSSIYRGPKKSTDSSSDNGQEEASKQEGAGPKVGETA